MVNVEVNGLGGVYDSLQQREKKLSGEMVKRAFQQGAETIARSVVQLAPKKTGYLANQVTVRARRVKDLARAEVAILKEYFPNTMPYGLVQNNGWYAGKRGGVNRKWIKGSGFFTQALLQNAESVPEAIVHKIKEEIEADGAL